MWVAIPMWYCYPHMILLPTSSAATCLFKPVWCITTQMYCYPYVAWLHTWETTAVNVGLLTMCGVIRGMVLLSTCGNVMQVWYCDPSLVLLPTYSTAVHGIMLFMGSTATHICSYPPTRLLSICGTAIFVCTVICGMVLLPKSGTSIHVALLLKSGPAVHMWYC